MTDLKNSPINSPALTLGGNSPQCSARPDPSCAWPRKTNERGTVGEGARWYGVHNAGASDARVHDVCERAGFEVYIPKVGEMRQAPRRELTASQRYLAVPVMRRKIVPLFPRYSLIRFDIYDSVWRDVFNLLGVRGLLCDASLGTASPFPFSDLAIAALRSREGPDGVIPAETKIKSIGYALGEQVRITGGAFSAHNAELLEELPDVSIEEIDPTARIKLLVALFGRGVVVEVPFSDIAKI